MNHWMIFAAITNWIGRFPVFKNEETKASNDAKLRALQMRGKGKIKYQGYKRPK